MAISDEAKLLIYNQALRICGERRLTSLTEARKPRYLLDQVSNEGGVDYCLEQGQWKFAMRTVQVDSDPDVSPAFGLTYGFSKPEDWIRTSAMCSDERFVVPYRDGKEEAGYWYADISPLYVRYVSNDAAFGTNASLWPATFSDFVASHFAEEVVFDLTSDKERIKMVQAEAKRRKRDALNKDAMNDPTQMPFRGSWVRSRFGRGNPSRFDGGSNSSLIG